MFPRGWDRFLREVVQGRQKLFERILLTTFPSLCWAFLGVVDSPSWAASSSTVGWRLPFSPCGSRAHLTHDEGSTPFNPSSDTPCSWWSSCIASPILSTKAVLDMLSFTDSSPRGPVSDAMTTGRVPMRLPRDAEYLRKTAAGSPRPPAPVDRRAWACW